MGEENAMNKITNTPSPPATLQTSLTFKHIVLGRTCITTAFQNMIEQTLLNSSREFCKLVPPPLSLQSWQATWTLFQKNCATIHHVDGNAHFWLRFDEKSSSKCSHTLCMLRFFVCFSCNFVSKLAVFAQSPVLVNGYRRLRERICFEI